MLICRILFDQNVLNCTNVSYSNTHIACLTWTAGIVVSLVAPSCYSSRTQQSIIWQTLLYLFALNLVSKWTSETDIKYKVCQFQSAVRESLIWCPALSRFQLGTVAFISPQFAILQCRHCFYTRCHCALSLGWGRWTIVVIKYSRFLKKESSVQRKSNKKRKK